MNGWREADLGSVATLQRGFDLPARLRRPGPVPIVSSSGVSGWHDHAMVKAPGVVTGRYGTIGEVFLEEVDFWPLNTTLWVSNFHGNDERFVYYMLTRVDYATHSGKSGVPGVNRNDLHRETVSVPDSHAEQRTIARALEDADGLIAALGRGIAKTRAIKQGMMQQLVTGRIRLPGFTDKWIQRDLGTAATILDNLRVPLSGAQRIDRTGPFPYCGANGVLDHIDDYMIDDNVILLAEDGGNFDQWATRPIAYRMSGKIWVNNHAHVLKAAGSHDTDFLFYALEHKDITSFISSGTRSKLTRGELLRIEVSMPCSPDEQRAIALVLADVDAKIQVLQERLKKAQAIKTGMMQELLTGRIRLPVGAAS